MELLDEISQRLQQGMTGEVKRLVQRAIDEGVPAQTIWEEGRNELVCGLQRAEWSLFHDTYIAYGDLEWQEGDRIQLEFTFGKGSFTLKVDELERVVME